MQELINELRQELTKFILPYWSDRMTDDEYGGFIGRIDGQNMPHPQADKGVVLNARILWTFSAAYQFTGLEIHKNIAEWTYAYFQQHFFDTHFGGVFWSVDYQGQPKDPKKQVYAQAFAIYGLSEFYKISQHKKSLDQAISLYQLMEKHAFDQENNGYFEAYDRKWQLLEDLRLSEKDANEKKSMNTHLHVLEAYSNLYRVWPDPQLKQQLTNLINIFLEKIIDRETRHFHLFFDEKWQVKSSTQSYGHDIEGSWLLQEAAEIIDEPELVKITRHIAIEMVDACLKEGFDKDHGLNYEKKDGHLDTDKHWWPQAEAVVGLINAWHISENQMYLDQALRVWDFIKVYMIDREKGEWYFRISRDHQPYSEEDKAGPWKCPYHNSRMCLEVINRLANEIT